MKREILKEYQYPDIHGGGKEVIEFYNTLVGRYFLIEDVDEDYHYLEAPDFDYTYIHITGVDETRLILMGISAVSVRLDESGLYRAAVESGPIIEPDFLGDYNEHRIYEISGDQFHGFFDDAISIILSYSPEKKKSRIK